MTTRRKFICDVIEKYKKDYAKEYSAFLDVMDYRRAALDNHRNASIKGQTEMRVALSLPEKVMNSIILVLDGVNEVKFLEEKGEMKWFTKKFPQFLLPTQW